MDTTKKGTVLEDKKARMLDVESELKELEIFKKKSALGMGATFLGREGILYVNQYYDEDHQKTGPVLITLDQEFQANENEF